VSGTSQIFTSALSTFSPEWNETVGTNSSPAWPRYDFQGYTGNGMIGIVLSIDYTFGYIDQGNAEAYSVPFASIINKAGNDDFAGDFHDLTRFALPIVDTPGPESYSIAAYTYLIIYKVIPGDCERLTEIFRYFSWILTDPEADALAASKSFAQISPSVYTLIEKVLNEVTCAGQPIYSTIYEGLSCPVGYEKVTPNGTETLNYLCTPCPVGLFNQNGTEVCYNCPPRAVCNGSSSLLAAANYWRNHNLTEPTFFQCLEDRCCPDGGCTMNDSCVGLFEGNLCASCPEGLYEWGNDCITCANVDGAHMLALGYFLLMFVVGAYIIISKRRTNFFVDLLFFFQIGSLLVDLIGARAQFLGLLNLNFDTIVNGNHGRYYPLRKIYLRFSFTLNYLLAARGVLCWLSDLALGGPQISFGEKIS